jgi:hypothetical protein
MTFGNLVMSSNNRGNILRPIEESLIAGMKTGTSFLYAEARNDFSGFVEF